MARATLLSVILALSLIGLADSWYLAESAVTDTPLVCGPGTLEGCNAVAQSPYSKLFGIPLGVYGIIFYGLIMMLSLVARTVTTRTVGKALLLVSGAGALASVAFLYIQFFLIKALCIYCLVSALVSFIIFGLAVYFFRREYPKALSQTPTP
jgi:uncharacterized membrane protein